MKSTTLGHLTCLAFLLASPGVVTLACFVATGIMLVIDACCTEEDAE